jgi:glycosyltransferase involved in cell wall biosynthesis
MASGAAPPRRVLHLIDTGGPGGAETILASLVQALSGEGWRSRVLVPEVDWLFGRLQESGQDVAVLAGRRSADLRFLIELTREVRRFRPGLVHAHLLGSGVYGSLAARLGGGVPVVTTFHGSPDVDPTDRLLRIKGRALRRSRNRIVYVSSQLREYLEPLLRLPREMGRVIYNGVVHRDRLPADGLRSELGFSSGHVIVGAVGNLRPAKDYANLLHAAAVVGRARKDIRFVVVGGGPANALESLERLQRELGVEDSVRFLGFRDDVRRIMSGFDIFTSSSSSEGLPLATLEAMGMGLPAVLTACGGPTEIVREGQTGLLVPPRSPEALAAGVLDLASDPERARRMGELARADVRRRFSAEAMLREYSSLYDEVAAES